MRIIGKSVIILLGHIVPLTESTDMLEKDNSAAMVNAEVSAVKSAVTLDPDNQKTEYSGHESAPYNSSAKKGDYGHDDA